MQNTECRKMIIEEIYHVWSVSYTHTWYTFLYQNFWFWAINNCNNNYLKRTFIFNLFQLRKVMLHKPRSFTDELCNDKICLSEWTLKNIRNTEGIMEQFFYLIHNKFSYNIKHINTIRKSILKKEEILPQHSDSSIKYILI